MKDSLNAALCGAVMFGWPLVVALLVFGFLDNMM